MVKSDTDSKYNDFFRLSLDLLCIAGFDGYFKELNPAWERTLGYTVVELLSRPYIEFIHPDDREATEAEAQKVRTGRETVAFENRFRRKDGSYIWLLWSSSVSIEGELFLAVAREITERKQTEGQYRLLVENAPYCIHQIDLAGRVIAMNKAGLKMLGLTDEAEIINQPYLTTVAEADKDRIAALLEKAYQGQTLEYEFRSENGRFFKSGLVPITDSDGSIISLMGITQDITEHTQAEQALRESEERFRSTFEQAAVGMAHVLPDGRWL
ncbi:MAG: PAS domain S-box protein, partial [Anaerolineae bacterium]|nr:PAS domain S-box protein [Anaerolineae bacterium]